MIRTRVFDIAASEGYANVEQLAEAIELSPALVYRIKANEVKIGAKFISGALKAFPDKELADLFYEDGEPYPPVVKREPAEALAGG